MRVLHHALADEVDAWRRNHFPCAPFPAIAEILDFAFDDDTTEQLRYLRRAQFRALETYWYLRLVLETPSVPALYEHLFPKTGDRLAAMGIDPKLFEACDYDLGALHERVLEDNAFVRQHHLESLRETLRLPYPSYILALAMGAGKTILMATIAATEFALAQDYPDGPFVRNALIFAPGKTIIESLREIADIPFERIVPPRLYPAFAASLKLTFTRDGDKELPVVWGSSFNLVVTNTEKIRIQRPQRRKSPQLALRLAGIEDHDEDIANLRLQAIASLPALAVFSDEAHHTYGQKLLGKWQRNRETGEQEFVEQGIKKVRRTVDYLARETDLRVVINTTGTPYFERQPLRDVVIWYGLGEGIRDGVLKELANNIQVFDLDESESDALVTRIVGDFFATYGSVTLPSGAPARLALYFPQTNAMDAARPAVETALIAAGGDPSTILAVHSKSSEETRREFFRVASDPQSPYRIILLINMGTEGWNCPSLFACGLVRKLKASNNFVLQAATRCLRQVPGNTHPARVYVAKSNRAILARQLEETFGTTLEALNHDHTERVEKEIVLRRTDVRVVVTQRHQHFRRRKDIEGVPPLAFERSKVAWQPDARVEVWTIAEPEHGGARLTRVDDGDTHIDIEPRTYTHYGAAAELGANYGVPLAEVLTGLRAAYGEDEVPEHHLSDLGHQIETQRADYESYMEETDVALALVKPDGFRRELRDGEPVYTARISFAKDRAHLYRLTGDMPDAGLARELSFHYEGYNFDSSPEAEYLERVLNLIAAHPERLDGVWFTGGLTDPGKTELYAEYLGDDGRWHRYTPDFVLRRSDGKHLVVEVKKDAFTADIRADLERHAAGAAPRTTEGRKAVALKRWEELNPDVLTYEVVFAGDGLAVDALDRTRAFVLDE